MYDSRLRCVAGLAVVLLAVAIPGCAGSGRIDTETLDSGDLSPKLQPFIYFEEGVPLFLAADVRAAQYVEKEKIFPIGVGLANLGNSALGFGSERFVIEDAGGQRYPVVGFDEYSERYRRSRSDSRLAETFDGILRARFENYSETEWEPFPVSGAASATKSRVELGRNYWTMAYLYFPVPDGGIHGREFTLIVDPDGTDERYLLRLAVP